MNGGRCWTRVVLPSEPAETGFWKIWGPNANGHFLTYGLWIADGALSTGFHSNAPGMWAPLEDPRAGRPITSFDASSDGAQTSTLVLEASLTDVVFAPNAPDTAFATGEGYDIYLSVDGGATFELLANLRSDVLNP